MRQFSLKKPFLTLMLSVFVWAAPAFSGQLISEEALRYPALVIIDNGGSASGFFMNYGENLYFITAKHVFFDQSGTGPVLKTANAAIFSYPIPVELTAPVGFSFDMAKLMSGGNVNVHPVKDIVVVRVTGGVKEKKDFVNLVEGVSKKEPFAGSIVAVPMSIVKRYGEIVPSNDVFIFGYPTSLGLKKYEQISPDKPLLRKGIVAGKNDKKRAILIDCPSYYGNSGGPCVEVEDTGAVGKRSSLIGVVTEFVPFEEKWVNAKYGLVNSQIENSGYSVVEPMDTVIELIEKMK
jgi:hypothetical protein